MENKWVVVIIALILVLVAYGGWKWYEGKDEPGERDTVREGDTVYVHYTGWLKDERVYGDELVMFDTSRQSKVDDSTIPRIATFDNYTRSEPLRLVVGAGSVIEGWEKRIKGMHIDDDARWTLPASEAYTPYLDELLVNLSTVESVPMREVLTRNEFVSYYPQVTPYSTLVLKHYFWTWDVVVEAENDETVTFAHIPTNNTRYTSEYGWESEVISINPTGNDGKGVIKAKHYAEVGMTVQNVDVQGNIPGLEDLLTTQRKQQQSSEYGVVVETEADTIVLDFNNEVYGKTLIFDIEIVDITKAQ